jgi:hypothetical protein
MTNQIILRTMMTQLDEASNTIPEGFYIQFCDHLQNLYHDEHDETLDTRPPAELTTEEDARAELCWRQVMLFVYPIWYLGLAIYYLTRFVYGILVFCFKGIHSTIKTQRETQTNYDHWREAGLRIEDEHSETLKRIIEAGLRIEAEHGETLKRIIEAGLRIEASQTPLDECGTIFVPEREWLGLIGFDEE